MRFISHSFLRAGYSAVLLQIAIATLTPWTAQAMFPMDKKLRSKLFLGPHPTQTQVVDYADFSALFDNGQARLKPSPTKAEFANYQEARKAGIELKTRSALVDYDLAKKAVGTKPTLQQFQDWVGYRALFVSYSDPDLPEIKQGFATYKEARASGFEIRNYTDLHHYDLAKKAVGAAPTPQQVEDWVGYSALFAGYSDPDLPEIKQGFATYKEARASGFEIRNYTDLYQYKWLKN